MTNTNYAATIQNFIFKAKIDALNFRAPTAPLLPKRQFEHAHGPSGFALHDPTRTEIERLGAYPLVYLEVAVDAYPRKASDPNLRPRMCHDLMNLLGGAIYPWAGPGITRSARTVGVDGVKGLSNRRSAFDVTTGVAESRYYGNKGDPAMMKIYYKPFDQTKRLIPLHKRWIRTELVLQPAGIDLLGLRTVGDLLTFNFRERLSPYFRFIKATGTGYSPSGCFYRRRHQNPELFSVLDARLRAVTATEMQQQSNSGGVHVFDGTKDGVRLNKNAGDEVLNRLMRRPLARIL